MPRPRPYNTLLGFQVTKDDVRLARKTILALQKIDDDYREHGFPETAALQQRIREAIHEAQRTYTRLDRKLAARQDPSHDYLADLMPLDGTAE